MKRFILVCAALVALGAILTFAGLSSGADTSVMFTGTGFRAMAGEAEDVHQQTDAFTAIHVEAGSGDVRVRTGSAYGYTVEGLDPDEYEIHLEDGALSIRLNRTFGWPLFSFDALIHRRDAAITVTVPEGTQLEAVTAVITSGTLDAEGLAVNQMVLTLTSGRADIRNTTTGAFTAMCTSGKVHLSHVTADALTLSTTSGHITGEDLISSSTVADITSGTLSLAGDLRGEVTVSVVSGTANVTLEAAIHEYARFLRATSGVVTVNGDPNAGNDSNSAAENTITATATSGSVHITFTEE